MGVIKSIFRIGIPFAVGVFVGTTFFTTIKPYRDLLVENYDKYAKKHVEWVIRKYKENCRYHNMYEQMVNIADNPALHPEYGNNSQFFDEEELQGIEQDLGEAFPRGKRIPYDSLERYVEMYTEK